MQKWMLIFDWEEWWEEDECWILCCNMSPKKLESDQVWLDIICYNLWQKYCKKYTVYVEADESAVNGKDNNTEHVNI